MDLFTFRKTRIRVYNSTITDSQRDQGQDFIDRVQIRNKVHIFGSDINIQRKQIDLGVWSGSERRSQFVLFLFDPVQIPEPDPSLYIYVRSKITRRIKMTIKGPYLILTNPDTLINTTANRLTRSHTRTEVSHLSGYNVNTGIINDPSLCHKIKNITLEQKNDWLISDLILLKSKKKYFF